MNKSSVIIILLITLGTVKAQTQEGSILTSGGFTFNFDNVKRERDNDNRKIGGQTTLEFNPSVGYFVENGIAVGVQLDWRREAFKDIDNDREIRHSVLIGPFARYYSQLGPYFQAQIGVGGGALKIKPENLPQYKSNYSIWSWAIGIGYPYFLGEHFAIEPVLLFSYQNQRYELDGSDVKDKLRGLKFQLGFAYYIFEN